MIAEEKRYLIDLLKTRKEALFNKRRKLESNKFRTDIKKREKINLEILKLNRVLKTIGAIEIKNGSEIIKKVKTIKN